MKGGFEHIDYLGYATSAIAYITEVNIMKCNE